MLECDDSDIIYFGAATSGLVVSSDLPSGNQRWYLVQPGSTFKMISFLTGPSPLYIGGFNSAR